MDLLLVLNKANLVLYCDARLFDLLVQEGGLLLPQLRLADLGHIGLEIEGLIGLKLVFPVWVHVFEVFWGAWDLVPSLES